MHQRQSPRHDFLVKPQVMKLEDIIPYERNGWAFADVSQPTAYHVSSFFKLITHGFKSFDEAFEYPLLEGRSIKECWDEVEFFWGC